MEYGKWGPNGIHLSSNAQRTQRRIGSSPVGLASWKGLLHQRCRWHPSCRVWSRGGKGCGSNQPPQLLNNSKARNHSKFDKRETSWFQGFGFVATAEYYSDLNSSARQSQQRTLVSRHVFALEKWICQVHHLKHYTSLYGKQAPLWSTCLVRPFRKMWWCCGGTACYPKKVNPPPAYLLKLLLSLCSSDPTTALRSWKKK